MFDVIIIGGRVAGSATAMLLARQGLDVLLVDRVGFPSDTLSTHQVQLPGVARLRRWGLLDQIVQAGTPPARHVRFATDSFVLEGRFPEYQGIDAVYSPRRTLLDSVLVEAARAAGAEVRERFVVDELTTEGGRVTGIRGRGSLGQTVDETARIVVGADGKHSLVAQAVGAAAHHERPPLSVGYYTYWAGVPIEGGEMYTLDGGAVGAWPTNDGLVMTYATRRITDFAAMRGDIEGTVLAMLDQAGTLGARVRAGQRADRFFGTADLPNRFRRPYGPGWALVGDAGMVMDPITGHGISDAFRDAELLADAVVDGLGGSRPLDVSLAGYERARDVAALPMYEFTTELASFAPPRLEQRLLLQALLDQPEEIPRFLGALTGTIPLPEYFSPRNLRKLLGARGMAKIVLSKLRQSRRRDAGVEYASAS